MDILYFDGWHSLLRTLLFTVIGYFSLIAILRITGKRSLSKMNAFDFVVTIALGSCLAAVALNKSIAMTDGIAVFLLLILLQFLITFCSVRIKWVKRLVTCQPQLLLFKGKILQDAMKNERITIEELYVAARANGIASLEDIDAIVLETTGDLSVIQHIPNSATGGSLSDVKIK